MLNNITELIKLYLYINITLYREYQWKNQERLFISKIDLAVSLVIISPISMKLNNQNSLKVLYNYIRLINSNK